MVSRLEVKTCMRQHRAAWLVATREANYSTFSGGRRTPSAYSGCWCLTCGRRWRTKAAYVKTLPDA